MEKTVSVIPATKDINTHKLLQDDKKKRVAAYVRVSTVKGNQFNSFEKQIEYHRQLINDHDDWILVDVYHDEGVTGTSVKKREGFCRMIDDALDGKIDLIITKSITRFARNTLDSIDYIRKLKEKSVGVYFENDNIWTLSEDGEFLITVIAAVAQEESRSISENTKWGMRKLMKRGKGCIGFANFLGYDQGYEINEEQAKVVRKIYDYCLYGYTPSDIVELLEEEGIKTIAGKNKWNVCGIKSILKNEKYKGDSLLQKYYVVDHISHVSKRNTGELPKYYVKNHHEPIITEEKWEKVQIKIKNFHKYTRTRVKQGLFRGIMYCEACEEKCRRRYHFVAPKYKQIYYKCIYRDTKKCNSPLIKERILILVIFDILSDMISKNVISQDDRNLIKVKNEKISCISIIIVHEFIKKILVVSDKEIEVVFFSGDRKKIDFFSYNDDYRICMAYGYIKGTLKKDGNSIFKSEEDVARFLRNIKVYNEGDSFEGDDMLKEFVEFISSYNEMNDK